MTTTLVFLPAESHRLRYLAGYSPWGHKELDTTKAMCKSISSFLLYKSNATKGRSTLHFQFDQILQFPICVLENLMVTSNASIPIDRSQSHDKDSLSGR